MEGKLIGEVAREVGVRRGTLRYYEALRLLPAARRSRGGYRLYDGEARRRMAFIANAKSLGLTLREIRQIVTARSAGRYPCEFVRTILADHVRQIDRQMARLQALKSELRAILRSSRTGPNGRAASLHAAVCPLIETVLPRARHRLESGGGT